MRETLVVDQSPREFFREAVSSALSSRRLRIQGETELYLVNLLASNLEVRGPDPGAEGFEDEPLAFILARALEGDREQRYREMKRLGDTALFLSGFFSDHLARTPVGARYYAAMGEQAYGSLAEGRLGSRRVEALYDELARRFGDFADLFAEIAELSDLRSNRGLVRLYQRFLVTGSQRLADRLRRRGLALFAGPTRPVGGPN
ncbi:MAG TPA: hypothetical protein VH880_10800 [Anaeromyxobacteraceae bacterium]|jgi:hypothetical protein